jgi:hypothetical protein
MLVAFPALLAGLTVLAVPLLLHLWRRQKPPTIRFPAFRFLLQRYRASQRKLRLRHLLLLLFRLLLLAALCLALARPRLLDQALALPRDQPLAAILLFDTSCSMDYRTSEGLSRLEEAKKRGQELLSQFPADSQVLVLDSGAEPAPDSLTWSTPEQARAQITALGIRPANAPLTTRLGTAFRLFAERLRQHEEEGKPFLPCFLAVFSDRTLACWDPKQFAALQLAADQVPPAWEGLQQVRRQLPTVLEVLAALPQQVPQWPVQEMPVASLRDPWEQLAAELPTLNPVDYPTRHLADLLAQVRQQSRRCLARLQQLPPVPEQADYRQQLRALLEECLERLRGVRMVFVDVGVDNPVNLGLASVELPAAGAGQPREVFTADETIRLRVVVQGTGRDYDTSVLCQVDDQVLTRPIRVQAGGRSEVVFDISGRQLAAGPHAITVRLAGSDPLIWDNVYYVTFTIREPRRVLILSDAPPRAGPWQQAIEARPEACFRCRVLSPEGVAGWKASDWAAYQVVYLLAVARPSVALWQALRTFAEQGGGVGILPAGEELDLSAYNNVAAQQLLPGKLVRIVSLPEPGVTWQWEAPGLYAHPLLRPVARWRELGRDDFIQLPRTASRFWEVQPGPEGRILVAYADPPAHAALLERRLGRDRQGGRVLLFTTRLDAGQQPRWNNYLETATSFCVVLPGLATAYLAGDDEVPHTNFHSGEVPVVRLPPTAGPLPWSVQGPAFLETVRQVPATRWLRLPEANTPGHYTLNDARGGRLAAFSVNLPADECRLQRLPPADIEALFGPNTLLAAGAPIPLTDLLRRYWQQPLELAPYLLLVLFLLLLAENVLSNCFYRRPAEEPAASPGS